MPAPDKSFREGYVEGWRAMMGGAAGVPPCTVCGVTDGRTEFQEGIRQAVERAIKRKAERNR